jgi:hypothetical protein
MRNRSLAIGVCIVLSGCDTPVGTEVTRTAAKSVVNSIVQDRFPGVPAEPVTDCVIDNASSSEIITLATAAGTGVTDQTIRVVTDVVRRPETLRCLTESAGPSVLGAVILGGS